MKNLAKEDKRTNRLVLSATNTQGLQPCYSATTFMRISGLAMGVESKEEEKTFIGQQSFILQQKR